jgi:hypothetical protein
MGRLFAVKRHFTVMTSVMYRNSWRRTFHVNFDTFSQCCSANSKHEHKYTSNHPKRIKLGTDVR